MNAQIKIESQRIVDDRTGRTLVSFTPVFIPDCTADGQLRFATWQGWEDDPKDLEQARTNALKNARIWMKRFAAITSGPRDVSSDWLSARADLPLTPEQQSAMCDNND